MLDQVKAQLQKLSDDDLFELLDCVSEEVKRRNGLLGPSIADVRNNKPEDNLKLVLEALAGLGVRIQQKDQKGDVIDVPAEPVKP